MAQIMHGNLNLDKVAIYEFETRIKYNSSWKLHQEIETKLDRVLIN
jgi:hypothetical protein